MTIDPATLNRRVTIGRYTLVPGDFNDEKVWSDLRTVWAAMAYDDVEEVFAGDGLIVKRTVTFTMRFSSDLTETDKLRCGGTEYNILGVTELGNRDGIAVKAEATDPEGV